ncbi:MAG: class I SAM-dependent methyltransferase [Alphaproteobacteria bacterium]|nr:class I SAM-dependent methyltransferase [Alphaproteobacteria bacterium]
MPRVLAGQVAALISVGALAVSWKLQYGVDPADPVVRSFSAHWIYLDAVIAVAFSGGFGLRRWWLAVQCALPIAAWQALRFDLPPWIFLIAFVILFAVYSNASAERVPLYLTNRTTWAALGEVLVGEMEGRDFTGRRPVFFDLGSGVGGTLAYLAGSRPEWDVVGVETAPGPYVVGWLRALPHANAQVRFVSLWDTDLSGADVVYAFLSPAPMDRLLEKARREMRPGALFVSNSFWSPDAPWDGEIEVDDARKTRLFFIRL